MPFTRSPNLANLKSSETVAISTEAKRRRAAGENVLDLGAGEPDFDTPERAAEAGIAAIRAGKTRYAPNVGTSELRSAMAGALSRMSGGRAVDPERLIVSNGSKQALFNACFALVRPGRQGADSVAGLGVVSADRAPRARRAGGGAGRSGVGSQGQRRRPGAVPRQGHSRD